MPRPKKAAAPKNALKQTRATRRRTGRSGRQRPTPPERTDQKALGVHKLQDPKDKRSIRADEKLLAVFDGKKAVSMFEMTKLVNGHFV